MIAWQPGITLAEVEKAVIAKALQFYGGNKTTTASALGISTKTIYNKLHSYGMMTKEESDKYRAEEGNGKVYDNEAEARLSVEPNEETTKEHDVSMSERQEVQELPPGFSSNDRGRSNSRRVQKGNSRRR
jgi:hypothetical protein